MITVSPLLEARALGRREPNNDKWLLQDVSLRLHAGSRLAIVGPTGAGKTLLLRALAMLDPIDEGAVRWRNDAVAPEQVPAFRAQAIYLHQRPALIEGTVEDNLRMPLHLRVHRCRESSRNAVLGLLQQVDRDEAFLERESRNLSGGEAQIVALMRAIQLEPAVLLLDEPTAALDEQSGLAIERLVTAWFQRAPAERGLLWVSHDKGQVARVADRVLVLRGGRLSENGWEG